MKHWYEVKIIARKDLCEKGKEYGERVEWYKDHDDMVADTADEFIDMYKEYALENGIYINSIHPTMSIKYYFGADFLFYDDAGNMMLGFLRENDVY